MNAESWRLRSTGMTSSDMRAIWAGALLSVYLVATAILLLAGHARVSTRGIALHLALLAWAAAATWLAGAPRWLRMWTPILMLLFLYSELPLLIRAAGHVRSFDAVVMQWEQAIFGGQPALLWAAQWPSRVASEVLHATYLSYYGVIISVPAGLYVSRRVDEFAEATFVLMLTFVACFVCYVVFPVAGPRYFWVSPASADAGPIRLAATWLLESASSRGTAFPSSHVAVAVTQSILAVRYFGKAGLVVPALTIGLALGAVYGGFHYAIDVLAGAALGGVMTLIGLLVAQRLTAQAKASAPT